MLEITALVRVSIARHRWLLVVMVTAVVIGVVVAWFSTIASPGRVSDSIAVSSLFFSLMPAGIASIVLFDYGLDQDLNLPESGCSHWILRMPIRAWKIAAVPIALKTIWISTLWILFVVTARRLDANEIPLIMPCVVFSATAVWIMVMSWRPFRGSFRRLVALLLAIPVLYCALAGAIAAPIMEPVQWRAVATAASVVTGISLYVGGVWCLIRSTQLARLNPDGIIPSDGAARIELANSLQLGGKARPLPVRHYRSPRQALFYHDYERSRSWILGLYALLVLPTIVLATLLIPLQGFSVVAAMFLFVYYAGFAGSRSFASSSFSNELPNYLAASPLRTKDLAWKRQLFPLAISVTTYLCILLLFAGWACWESNRETWMKWAQLQSASLDGQPDWLTIGVRLSIAIVLGVGVFAMSRLAAIVWVGMTGRTWVSVAAIVGGSLAFLILFGILLRWFLQQTDWETAEASARHYLAMLSWLVGGLLALKACIAVGVSIASLHQKIVTVADLLGVTMLWAGLCGVIGISFYLLLPYPYATLTWCLMLTALTIPLARVLVLPLALSWNRHR